MKKIFTIAVLGLLASATPVVAQTVYDGAKLTGKDLNGTARFVGMGGAMGALGGDISTMSTNPAGIGLFRSSDVMTSFGFSAYGTESKYLDNKLNSDKSRASFDNIGFVFSSKIGNNTPLRFVNFGFNYHKAKSFYKNMNMKGNLGDYSQTFLMASQAGGIEGWGDNPYDDPNIGWLSVLGYDGWVITDIRLIRQQVSPIIFILIRTETKLIILKVNLCMFLLETIEECFLMEMLISVLKSAVVLTNMILMFRSILMTGCI